MQIFKNVHDLGICKKLELHSISKKIQMACLRHGSWENECRRYHCNIRSLNTKASDLVIINNFTGILLSPNLHSVSTHLSKVNLPKVYLSVEIVYTYLALGSLVGIILCLSHNISYSLFLVPTRSSTHF